MAVPERTPPQYVDIGVNLTDEMYSGLYHGKQSHAADLDTVLARARAAGVLAQMVTAGSVVEVSSVLELLANRKSEEGAEELYSTAGVHPTRSGQVDTASYLQDLATLLEADDKRAAASSSSGSSEPRRRIVAIGECGLDYDRLHFSDKEAQLARFEEQLSLAVRFRRPLFLHCRAAQQDFVRILQPQLDAIAQACQQLDHGEADGFDKGRRRTGVAHCFTGTVNEMRELVDLGLFIGLTGCSVRTEEGIEVAKAIPLDRLMLETDAPWCDIRPTHASSAHVDAYFAQHPEDKDLLSLYRPATVKKEKYDAAKTVKGRNEPCAIGLVAAVVAQVKGLSIDEVAKQARANTKFLFGI